MLFGEYGSYGGYGKGDCEHYGGYTGGFTLIVVRFILLIIVGASFYRHATELHIHF